MLEEFPTLLRPRAAQPKPLHGVVHHIDTGSTAPVFARPRRLDPEKHRIAEEEFLSLEKAGIICTRRGMNDGNMKKYRDKLVIIPTQSGSSYIIFLTYTGLMLLSCYCYYRIIELSLILPGKCYPR